MPVLVVVSEEPVPVVVVPVSVVVSPKEEADEVVEKLVTNGDVKVVVPVPGTVPVVVVVVVRVLVMTGG